MPIHIAAGGLAIVLGAVALSVKKGGTIYRRSGLLFVGVMGATAALIGFRNSAADPNVFAGLMTAYFVVTALTARCRSCCCLARCSPGCGDCAAVAPCRQRW